MNRLLFITILSLIALAAVAQPPARRAEQAEQTQTRQQAAASGNLVGAAYRDFPTAQAMPADAAWRRDIYRSLDLSKEKNATLYYPVEPINGQQSLFNFLFRAILRGQIKAYEYSIDAVEHLDAKHQIRGKALMDKYQIYYESKDGKIRVNDADIASVGVDVRMYYIKEAVYYDQHTASFRTKVKAICPVRVSGLGGEDALRTPLFWVDYEEAAPQLAKLMLSASSYNNAAVVSADDYFTMAQYEGDIYKTSNLQDLLLADVAETPEAQRKEQQRIEGQLTQFQNHVWGRDSLAVDDAALEGLDEAAAADSVAAGDAAKQVTSRRGVTARRGSAKAKDDTSSTAAAAQKRQRSSATAPKQKKQKTQKAKSGKSSGGLSVRRERH